VFYFEKIPPQLNALEPNSNWVDCNVTCDRTRFYLIMLHWQEFSAWVTIEGVEAPEYAVEVSEDEKTVTCWIPSELGKVPPSPLSGSNSKRPNAHALRNLLSTTETRHTPMPPKAKSRWTETGVEEG
jgi:hypothetical protein